MDQFLTYKKGNLGPVFNFTAYIYIYMFLHIDRLEADGREGVRSKGRERKKGTKRKEKRNKRKEQRQKEGVRAFSFLSVINRRLKFIQYRTGVWKCPTTLPPDLSPSTRENFWIHKCKIFIQYWAVVWQPHSQGTKGTPKPKAKKSHEQYQEIFEQFEGVTGHYPVKQGF